MAGSNGKKKRKSRGSEEPLSSLAIALVRAMAAAPEQVEYNTRVLGGMFTEEGVALLDAAYADLNNRGLVEPVGAVLSFFGVPKPLMRITDSGRRFAEKWERSHTPTQPRDQESAA